MIEYKFHIDPNKIRVQDPQTGFHDEMLNRAVVLPKDRLLVGLGDSEEKVRARLMARYEKSARELRTRTLFGPNGEDLDFEVQAFQYLVRLLNQQSRPAQGWRYWGALLGNNIDFTLDIPGYETFPEARRQALEANLQAHHPIHHLTINGTEVQIAPWKRSLELWLRRLLCQVLPILVIVIGYLVVSRSMAGKWFTFFLVLTAIGYSFYYGGRVVWMLLARRLVPPDYRMCVLLGARRRIPLIDMWLARLVWGLPQANNHA